MRDPAKVLGAYAQSSTVESFPFWIVLRHIGSTELSRQHKNQVTVFHDTEASAKAEALRLARQTSTRFYVMKATGYVQPQDNPMQWDDGTVEEDPV